LFVLIMFAFYPRQGTWRGVVYKGDKYSCLSAPELLTKLVILARPANSGFRAFEPHRRRRPHALLSSAKSSTSFTFLPVIHARMRPNGSSHASSAQPQAASLSSSCSSRVLSGTLLPTSVCSRNSRTALVAFRFANSRGMHVCWRPRPTFFHRTRCSFRHLLQSRSRCPTVWGCALSHHQQ